jgi:Tol biopolymer transport system component
LPPTPLPLPFTDGWLVYSSPWPYKGEMGLIRPNGTDGRLIPIVSAISDGLPQSPGVSESSITTGFNWSPDGRWLAFTFVDFGPTSTNSEIGIIRSDGSGFRRITFGPNFKYDPAWSPDGQFIAYSYFEYGNKGISDIAITRLDGSSTWQLTGTPDEDEKYPAWSPDGTKLAFLSNNMLMVIDADGKNRRSVTEDWLANGRIAWSPDGLQIAFSAGIGCGQIYAIALQGGQSRQITDFPGCASSPSWSPDGRYLAFIGTQPGANGFNDGDLYVISIVDNATPWLVLDAQQKGGLKYAPDNLSWSPVPSLLVGENYVITAIGANLNLRQSATLHGASLRRLAAGEIVTVLEGPLDAEDYYWWRLRTADGLEGWAVDWLGWYAPAAGAATPTPGP